MEENKEYECGFVQGEYEANKFWQENILDTISYLKLWETRGKDESHYYRALEDFIKELERRIRW